MAVKKKSEREVEAFIMKGGGVAKKDDSEFKVITLRLPKDILDKVDVIIKENSWLTRNGWIVSAINKHLIMEDKE